MKNTSKEGRCTFIRGESLNSLIIFLCCLTSFMVVHSFMFSCITILFIFILPLPTDVKQRLHIYVKMYAGIGMYHGGN